MGHADREPGGGGRPRRPVVPDLADIGGASTAAHGEAIEAALTALDRAGIELPVDELRGLGPRAGRPSGPSA